MEVVEKIHRVIKSCQYDNIFKILNDIDDPMILFNVLNDMNEKEKTELEEAVIGITDRTSVKDETKDFLKKYKEYVLKISKDNYLEYMNNNYLRFLYHNEYNKMTSIEDYDNDLNGESVWDIYDKLCEKYNSLIKKVYDNKELSKDEHKYIKRFFLTEVFYSTIIKKYEGENDIMYDIVDYFDKYPFENYKGQENKQLFILYNLSKQLINFDVDTVITFDRFHNEPDIESNGFFKKIPDGRFRINISNLDIDNEKEMYDRLFTIFHELSHLVQTVEKEKYPPAIQDLFEKEKYIINNDDNFYHKFHDSFYLEVDADQYALTKILELFKEEKPELIMHLINKEKNKKRIEFSKMYNIIYQKYNQLIEKINKGKVH